MLSRFRLSHKVIRYAIVHIDDSKLSIDNLKAIKQNSPQTDEVSYFISQSTHLTQI